MNTCEWMEIKCGCVRTTKTGTKLLDILNDELFQTPYLEIIHLENNRIVTISDNIMVGMDKQIKTIVEKETGGENNGVLCDEFFEIKYGDKTIMWEDGEYVGSGEINKKLMVGDKVRYIIKFKKIDIKNLKVCLEILQIEKKCV
jgi:hypothetical protein